MLNEIDVRKHVEKLQVQLEVKLRGEDTYWSKQIWDESKPLALVLANYPTNANLLKGDLTGMLIRNGVIEIGKFGGMIIANLFTRPVKYSSDKSLSVAYAEDGMAELVKAAKEADRIIIATGSLPSRSLVAEARLGEFWNHCKQEHLEKRVTILVNGRGKAVHPLAIRNEPWQFTAWDSDWMKDPKGGD
ncbi:DUF1643 domain-containing protein [Levilactobacillus brevis]|uniref:DUF1643 domain-containing protein n=1 Tax=Levilactobacillus brevis TaxID=1580 RepID=UPI0004103511|nr:DUF1643 domain-containing protein [Levilactobacillus brevis]ARN93420.1 hypothetical protein AZI11_11220 [Levilactobacillus brevis]ATU70772.1 DUF1643 domain-containing protein [Levilactobacillus brevis]